MIPTPSNASKFKLKFHARGEEYFAIWWVNTLLTVITLGLYYPWAKVRTTRYLFANTELQGSRFEYLAKPKQLLKGFLIVYVGMFSYFVLSVFMPALAAVIVGLVLVLLPWLLLKSLQFKAVMTSYRGIRFQFNANAMKAYGAALVGGLMIVLTGGLAMPWVFWRFQLFIVNHLQFGNQDFVCKGTFRPLFKVYAASAALYFGLFVVMASFMFNLDLPQEADPQAMEAVSQSAMFGIFLLGTSAYLLLFLVIKPWIQVTTINNLWGKTTIGQSQVQSQVPLGKAIVVLAKNGLLILITLGLYYPLAVLNWWRLRFDYVCVQMTEDFDQIIASEQQRQGALGESAADMLDVGFGL